MSKPAKSKAGSISYDPIILTNLSVDSVQLAKARLWVHERMKLELGAEDEIVENLVISTIEEHAKDRAREWSVDLQIQLTGFLEDRTPKFMSDLWKAFLSGFKDGGKREDDQIPAKVDDVPPPPSHAPPPGLGYGNANKDAYRMHGVHDKARENEEDKEEASKRESRREKERELDNPVSDSEISESKSSGSDSEEGSSRERKKRRKRDHRHDSKRKRSLSRGRKHERLDKRGSRRRHRRHSDISDSEEDDEKAGKRVRRGDGLEDDRERPDDRRLDKARDVDMDERALHSDSESESRSDRRRRKHRKSKRRSKSHSHKKRHRSERRGQAGYSSSSGSESDKEEDRHKDKHKSRKHRRDDSDSEHRSDSDDSEDGRKARKRKRQHLHNSDDSGDERKHAKRDKGKARDRKDIGNISDGSMDGRDRARLDKHRKEHRRSPPRSPHRRHRDNESSLDSRRPFADDDRIRDPRDYDYYRSGINRPEHRAGSGTKERSAGFAPRDDHRFRDDRRRNPHLGNEPDLRETLIGTDNHNNNNNNNNNRNMNHRFRYDKNAEIRLPDRRDNRRERPLNGGDPGPPNGKQGEGTRKNEPIISGVPENPAGGSIVARDLRDMLTERREMQNVKQDIRESHDFRENVASEIEIRHEHDDLGKSGEKLETVKEEDDELARKCSSKKVDEGKLLREKLLDQLKRKRKAKELRQMALESLKKKSSLDGRDGHSPFPTGDASGENLRDVSTDDLDRLDAEQGGSILSDHQSIPRNDNDRDAILECVGSEHAKVENDDMTRSDRAQDEVDVLEQLEPSAAIAKVDIAEGQD